MFTIAIETHECYGHGDYGTEQRICRVGEYGQGDFPPLFHTYDEAEEYRRGLEWNSNKVVVELKEITKNFIQQ